jgi:aminoglycoside phosphotransferase (APT) family kinase protein
VDRKKIEAIAQRVAAGAQVKTVLDLKGGVSSTMTLVELDGGDHQHIIVRAYRPKIIELDPQVARREAAILRTLQRTAIPTPTLLSLDESGALWPTPYLVLNYLPGAPVYAPDDPVALAKQMADQLLKIHRIDDAAAISFLPDFARGVSNRLSTFPDQLDDALDESAVRAALSAHWPLDETAANAPSFLHGDFWPGNILYKDGAISAVLDWEDAAHGDPLADITISELDILWGFGEEAMAAFTAQYQAGSDADFSQLAIWRLAAAMRPMGLLDIWAPAWTGLGRADITVETMRAGHKLYVSKALAAL